MLVYCATLSQIAYFIRLTLTFDPIYLNIPQYRNDSQKCQIVFTCIYLTYIELHRRIPGRTCTTRPKPSVTAWSKDSMCALVMSWIAACCLSFGTPKPGSVKCFKLGPFDRSPHLAAESMLPRRLFTACARWHGKYYPAGRRKRKVHSPHGNGANSSYFYNNNNNNYNYYPISITLTVLCLCWIFNFKVRIVFAIQCSMCTDFHKE